MTIESEIFKRYSVDFKKLIKYGFKKDKDRYLFNKLFKNNEFRAEIIVLKSGETQGRVYETESDDEFLPLRIKGREGSFTGIIREEYKQILTDIRDNCFVKNYFIYPQSNRITNAIISKYGDSPAFMWEQFPGFGVFKNPTNNKWYGAIMNIDYSKLGKDSKKPVEIINLKLDKNEIQDLIKKDGFYPAWHMNKKSWITVALDETLSDEKILKLIEESHSYTVKTS